MSYAPITVTPRGQFIHKETGVLFEYDNNIVDSWARAHGATHNIYLENSIGHDVRYAIIKKTIAYVIVDEDNTGNPVWEKWPLKSHSLYNIG